ncbi:MAG TPA: hypothetical protein VFC63_20225 [Blastocatellia bacterium]|nr:hypothetical protein [Blastocatellia bacterium]
MRRMIVMFLLCCFGLISVVSAQKDLKSWTTWSDKDCAKILSSSGWSQTQTDTDTSQLQFGQSSKDKNPMNSGSMGSGSSESGTNAASSVNYRIRFLSARPVREAFIRQLMIKRNIQQLPDNLKQFAEGPSDDYIVVAVSFDSGDRRAVGPATQAFGSATIGTLQNTTYLERKDGKRLFVAKYQSDNSQGFGYQFVFPRMVDGKPFISADTGSVRFYGEIPSNPNPIKLDMRFKVQDMMVDGKLEY